MARSLISRPGRALNLPNEKKSSAQNNNEEKGDQLIKYTLDLLERAEKEIKFDDKHKDVILILGNTGSGKSTFTQWVAGDNTKMISIETKEGTGEYIIVDHNRIGNTTLKSKTIFPELVVDEKTNAAYYDCPGFSDTQGTSHDIATTYFIKNVVDFSESVKMIFTISHPSVRKGVDRQDFMKLLRHVADLVKDIEKFKHSIAIVVTKVDNQYIKQGNNFILVEDNKVISAIADFLEEAKQYLEDSSKRPNLSEKEKQFYKKATSFIDILLEKDSEHYPKIGIFRRPDGPGPISDISLLQNGKKYVEKIVYDKLNFTTKINEDFGYTVSEKTKNDINDIVEEINKNLWSSLSNIAGKIQEYYRSVVEQIRCKIRLFNSESNAIVNTTEAEDFKQKFNNGYNITSDLVTKMMNLTNPEELALLVNSEVSNLDVDIPKDDVLYIASQGRYFNFLQAVSDKILSSKSWDQLFQDMETFFSNSKTIILHDVDSAAGKINNRIQIHMNDTMKAMYSEYTEKIKSLELQKLPEKLNRDSRIIFNLTEEIKNETTTEKLVDVIRFVADNLGVISPKENLQNIANQGKNLEFLEVISNETLVDVPMTWLSPFHTIANYFYESGKWYTFLEDLYKKFSEYEIQKERQRYNVADLEDWGQPGKPQGISVTPNTFEKFLNKIGNYNLTEYETVRNLTTTGLQIDELNQVLSLTLKHRSTVSCSEPFITIKGNYVSLNETMQSIINNSDTNNSCNNFKAQFELGKYTLFKVLALNKIFIDTDLSFSGKGTSVVIIAPKWEVINSRTIELHGADGATYLKSKARNGLHPGNDGVNGAPGKPARSGESFFGIGSVFVNGANLKITSNGGKGGRGQDGGNGARGVPGRDAQTPYDYDPPCENGYVRGFECEEIKEKGGYGGPLFIGAVVQNIGSCTTRSFKIFGLLCVKGSNGGNGGIGGKGGDPGNIDILELSQPSKITKFTAKGKGGEIGKGGDGSQQSKNGDDIIADWSYCRPGTIYALFGKRAYTKWKWKETIENNVFCPAGSIGKSGENDVNIQPPITANGIRGLPNIINEYKIYLRENINNRFKKHFLLRFLDQLNSRNDVRKLYDILGLIDEFYGLEEQFHKLSKQMDFSPFYSSVLERISEFAKNHKDGPNSGENKKILNHLYTATLGRIYNLKENSESYLVLDIRGYLNLVKENVKSFKDIQTLNNKVDVINKYKVNYKRRIEQRIEEAKSFINKQIIPEIDNISGRIDDQLNTLIEETISLVKQAKKQKRKLAEKKEELENALTVRGLFKLFRIIGGIVSFLGPIGAAAGAVIEVTSTVAESLALNDQHKTLNLPSDVVSDIKSLGDQIKTMRNQKVAYLSKLLDNVSEEINKNPEKLSDMTDKIAEIKDKLTRASERFDFKQVKELENELNQELKRKGDDLKIHSSDKKSLDALKVIGKLTQIAQFGSLLLNVYDKMKAEKEKIDAITDAMEQIDDKIKKLKEYEESIYNTIVPMLQEMEADMKNISDKLEGKSQVVLDVTKWQVQTTLKDMRLQMQRLTEGFEVKDDLKRSIEKLDEVMTTLINIYDRMQSYQDQQNLANYIADISSVAATSIGIKDKQLSNATNNLESVIRANIVLNQYKSALNSFKQWVFPFGDRYIQEAMLPSQLELDTDIRNIVQNAVKGIETMNEELVLYNTTWRKGDQYLERQEFSSQYNSSRPFFVWKNEEHGSVIANLLSGKEVVLKADIKDSAPYKDAIKFSEINFYFKTKNETAQSLLLETLKGFDIRATHMGNSYYRYANKFFLITSDSVSIKYSFEKNNAGLPLRSNKGYDQLKAGDFLLSPFTLWEVIMINQTNDHSFHDLERYKNEVNLELSGFGHYVDTYVLGLSASNSFTVYNNTKLPDFKSNATDVNECKRSKHRLTRSLKDIIMTNNPITNNPMTNDPMTNGAPVGIPSPINFLCNFLKTYFITNAITSINQIFLREQRSVRNHDDCSELTDQSTEMGKFGTAMASSPTTTDTVKVDVTSAKDDYIKERISTNSNAIFSVNFDGDSSSKSSLLSAQKDGSNTHSLQVPDLNCSLLLADLVTRTITGNRYKSAIDECLLSPREVILRKISDEMVLSESDVKHNLQRLLSEKDDVRPSSWFTKLNSYTKSTLRFFGLARNDHTEEYVQDVRNLYS